MFNLGLGEVSIVLAAAALVFGVDEFKSAYQWIRSLQKKIFSVKSQVYNELNQIEDKVEEEIVDLEGNLQKRYSLDAVSALLEEEKHEKSDEK